MKKLSSTLLMLLVAVIATAAPINKQQAREYAKAFLNATGRDVANEARRTPGKTLVNNEQPLYIFNASGANGFVIIAGDDRIDPVLGYTENGSYDEDNLSDNLKYWIDLMIDEICALPPIERGSSKSPMRVPTHSAISPLIKTKWSQGSSTETGYIYNTLTPTINSKHCLTGCVATAGAQLMYYYQYPQAATLSVPGYEANETLGTLAGLPAIQFNWSQMKKKYTSSDVGTASEKAVSQLMLYCGYAAHMDYGLNGSGASISTLARNMAELFDYDAYTWKYASRSYYSVVDWDALIYGELKAGRPVLFSGSGNQGGHAFICDGYDGAGLYHFNWGWGGSDDGYFKLNATNPYNGSSAYDDGSVDNGFALGVGVVIGLQPNTGQGSSGSNDDQDTWETPSIDGIVATAYNPMADGIIISTLLQNGNSVNASLGMGLGELNADGTITVLDTKYEYFKKWDLDPGYYWTSFLNFDVSSYSLSEGKHTLVFISMEKDDTQWQRCRPADLYYEVDVAGGNINIVQHPLINLEVNNFACTSSRLPNKTQLMSFDVKNVGDNYDGYLYLFASKTEDKGYYQDWTDIKIKSGNTKQRTMSFRPEEEGVYNVWISTDWKGENVIAKTTVTIEQKLKVTKFDFTGNKFATVIQHVTVNVESMAGDYTEPLYLFASTTSSKGDAKYVASAAIEGGQSEDIDFYFKPLNAGTYNVWICTDEEGKNVIGTTKVVINPVPTYEIALTKVDVMVDATPMGSITLRVKNGTQYDYNDSFMANLFIYENDDYSYVTQLYIPNFLIKAGETQDVKMKFEDLDPGTTYYADFYYKPKVGGKYSWMGETSFTIKESEYRLGDVNLNGVIDVTDVMLVVYHILGSYDPKFHIEYADMNGDGTVNVTDAMLIVDYILTQQ